jgi:hypothetical protein
MVFPLAVMVKSVPVVEVASVIAEPVCSWPVGPRLVIPLPPAVIHVPLTEKHPVARFIPFANVEVAVVEVTFSAFVCMPPAKVDVAVVVAVKYAATV